MTRAAFVAGALLAAAAARAEAQVELGAGGGFAGALSLGGRDAELRSNSVTTSAFRLFSSDTRLDPSPLLEVRLGYRLSPRLTIEGLFGFARPTLTSSLTADVEDAAPVEATGTVTEYVIDGGALWRLSTNTRRRWTPFVSGGAGVARQVHEGQTLIESGIDSYVGGGVSSRLGARTGLRVDGRVRFLSGGLAADEGVAARGVVTGSVFVTF